MLLVSLILLMTGQAIPVSAGSGTWTRHGPECGRVYALAIDPQTPSMLYAGTYGGGVFKSTDGGTSWGTFDNGLTDLIGRFS